MKKNVQDIKNDVENEVYEAFNAWVSNKVKELKASMQNAEKAQEDANTRVDKLSKEFRGLNDETLWKEFFKYDMQHMNSPYERFLLNK